MLPIYSRSEEGALEGGYPSLLHTSDLYFNT